MRKLRYVFAALLFVASALAALGQQAPSEVHVRLSLAEAKTTYRIGEPIKLLLEFTSDRDGYQADVIPDSYEPTSDVISVSPDTGFHRWLEEDLGVSRG